MKKGFVAWISVSSVLSVVAVLLMGPSKVLRIPDNLTIMGVGIGLLGVTCQLISLAMVLNTLEPLYKMFPGQNSRISKLFGAYRQVAVGLALFSSPLYASGVTSLSSYETTCDSMALIVLMFLTVFLVIHLRAEP